MTREERIQAFADLLQQEQFAELAKRQPVLSAIPGYKEQYHGVRVIPGKKYVKVDVGTSGKYMIEGEIVFGIKAYGVIHRGHQYGTLDTINEWDWSGYVGVKKA